MNKQPVDRVPTKMSRRVASSTTAQMHAQPHRQITRPSTSTAAFAATSATMSFNDDGDEPPEAVALGLCRLFTYS